LELTDKGFDHTVLSEFRTRLITTQAESLVFEHLLEFCQQQGWLQARSRQRTDSTQVLATIRAMTRLECAGETLRAALNALAVVAATWLQAQSQAEWVDRYSERIEDHHLPVTKAGREQKAQVYGEDGKRLLTWSLMVIVQTGYGRSQPSKHCDEFGCSSTMYATTEFIGAQSKAFHPPP
jgi:transposase